MSNNITPDLVESNANNKKSENETNSKLANLANVGKETYRKAKRILDSENEILKQEVLIGTKTIDAGYKELNQKKQERENINRENNTTTTPLLSTKLDSKPQISDEVKQICADLKTEKSQEYLESIVMRLTGKIEENEAKKISKEIVSAIDWNNSALMHKGLSWMAKNYLMKQNML